MTISKDKFEYRDQFMTELIYCANGNRRFAEIAIRYGLTYGAQLPATVYYPPVFADQNWKQPDRTKYMAALAEHKPRMATVLDWERDDQYNEALSWAWEAAQHVSEAVIIIPKVIGGIPRLPRTIAGKQVRLGYSVPTKFGATQVPQWEFMGWPVHALGGSPMRQLELAAYLDIRSADGNYIQGEALKRGQVFVPGASCNFPKFYELVERRESDVPYAAFTLSVINMLNAWQHITAAIRYATEADLPAIKAIANQYRSELGYVMFPALRTAISKDELFVAVYDSRVVGFVNWHRRRDGWSTVYDIAVHRDFRGQCIGQALMNAVPKPVRLKTTTDNVTAQRFYEAYGFENVRTEAGRKRELYVFEMVA